MVFAVGVGRATIGASQLMSDKLQLVALSAVRELAARRCLPATSVCRALNPSAKAGGVWEAPRASRLKLKLHTVKAGILFASLRPFVRTSSPPGKPSLR